MTINFATRLSIPTIVLFSTVTDIITQVKQALQLFSNIKSNICFSNLIIDMERNSTSKKSTGGGRKPTRNDKVMYFYTQI